MASGDPQRVWFEEMVDRLRSKWLPDVPIETMIRLRDDLDGMLQEIRRKRQICSPLIKCPECGHVGESAPPHVSVRAMILSVSRFNIDDCEATRAAEKAWKAYKRPINWTFTGTSTAQSRLRSANPYSLTLGMMLSGIETGSISWLEALKISILSRLLTTHRQSSIVDAPGNSGLSRSVKGTIR